jgi:hypothetical protein
MKNEAKFAARRALLLPPGKRGRIRLVLSRPYEARVYAFLVGLLRSWPVL